MERPTARSKLSQSARAESRIGLDRGNPGESLFLLRRPDRGSELAVWRDCDGHCGSIDSVQKFADYKLCERPGCRSWSRTGSHGRIGCRLSQVRDSLHISRAEPIAPVPPRHWTGGSRRGTLETPIVWQSFPKIPVFVAGSSFYLATDIWNRTPYGAGERASTRARCFAGEGLGWRRGKREFHPGGGVAGLHWLDRFPRRISE